MTDEPRIQLKPRNEIRSASYAWIRLFGLVWFALTTVQATWPALFRMATPPFHYYTAFAQLVSIQMMFPRSKVGHVITAVLDRYLIDALATRFDEAKEQHADEE